MAKETRSGTSNRGFASMDPEMQRAIASKGGKAAHQSGNAHRFTSEEAREAGRKGGQAAHRSSGASRRTADDDDSDAGKKSYQGNDQSVQGGGEAKPRQHAAGYPEAENEGRGHGRSRDVNQVNTAMADYQSENQGRNQGRNNFSTDQERAHRSGQGRDR